MELKAQELSGYSVSSNIILQDAAFGLEKFLMTLFGKAVAWYEPLAGACWHNYLAASSAVRRILLSDSPLQRKSSPPSPLAASFLGGELWRNYPTSPYSFSVCRSFASPAASIVHPGIESCIHWGEPAENAISVSA